MMTPIQTVRPIYRVIRRVRLRMVAMAVANRVVLMLALGLITSTATVAGIRSGLVSANGWQAIPWILGAASVFGVIWGLSIRISDLIAAKWIDDANLFADRLGNAISFATVTAPTPFMVAAIHDAINRLPTANPAVAAPWKRPRHLWTLALAAGAFASLAALRPPLEHREGNGFFTATLSPPPKELKAKLLPGEEQELTQTIEALRAQLEDQTNQHDLSETQKLLAELKELLEEIRAGKTNPEDAMLRLEDLERRFDKWTNEEGQKLDEIKEKLRLAAEKMKEDTKALEQLKNALDQGDLKAAAEALKKMADPKLTQREKERQKKELERLANALKDEKTRQMEQLKSEIDRLQKKEEQNRLSSREQDRLAKKKKELAQLQKEKEQNAKTNAEKQLERLTKTLDQAASEQQRNQGDEQNGEEQSAIDRAAEEMRRLSDAEQQKQTMRRMQRKMGAAKDLAKRSSMKQRGGTQGENGESQNGGQQLGQDAQQEQDSDRLGQTKRRRLEEFMARSGSKPFKGNGGGHNGEKKPAMMDGIPGNGAKTAMGSDPGDSQGQQAGGQGEGSQAGSEPDHRDPLGETTGLDSKRQDTFVAGQKTKGPSRSETIFGAAGEGFAGTSYKTVYHDYESVIEEDMLREQIPAGHRRYIERYFDIIGPQRDQ